MGERLKTELAMGSVNAFDLQLSVVHSAGPEIAYLIFPEPQIAREQRIFYLYTLLQSGRGVVQSHR